MLVDSGIIRSHLWASVSNFVSNPMPEDKPVTGWGLGVVERVRRECRNCLDSAGDFDFVLCWV